MRMCSTLLLAVLVAVSIAPAIHAKPCPHEHRQHPHYPTRHAYAYPAITWGWSFGTWRPFP